MTPVYFISYGNFRNSTSGLLKRVVTHIRLEIMPQSRILSYLLLALISYRLIYLFFAFGIQPSYDPGPVNLYLRYFLSVINNHGIVLNNYFTMFFNAKGTGLIYLIAILADIQTIPLITFYFYIMTLLMLFLLIKRFIGKDYILWTLLGLIIFLSSYWISNDYDSQKPHIMVNAYFMFIMYISTFMYTVSLHDLKKFFFVYTISGLVVVIMLPMSFPLVVFIIGIQLMLSVFFKKYLQIKYILFSIMMICFCYAAVLAYNNITSGVTDFNPRILYSILRNDEKIKTWISPSILSMAATDYTVTTPSDDTPNTPAHTKMLKEFLYANKILSFIKYIIYETSKIPFYLYLLLLVISIYLFSAKRKQTEPYKQVIIYSNLLLLFALFAIKVSYPLEDSIERFLFISLIFTRAVIQIWIFYSIYHLSMYVLKSTEKIKQTMLSLFIAMILLLYSSPIIYIFPYPFKYGILYCIGKLSYEDFYNRVFELSYKYENNIPNVESWVYNKIGSGNKILVLTANMMGIYVSPRNNFIFGEYVYTFNQYKYHDTILFGSTGSAVKILKTLGINYILVNLHNPLILLSGFAPVFSAESIRENFTIVANRDQLFLLKLKAPEDIANTDGFAKVYASILESKKTPKYIRWLYYNKIREEIFKKR
ncbi:MAG: hypothetical protein HQK90_12470 [Nitrospirae bacterium]|nr:hypothetical protein [Nitrospirota bacterium]